MRKLFYLFYLIGSGVLVSFRGGNITYLLFYSALLLPAAALIYSIYVYLRFKIVQDVSRTVVKAQEVPYRLLLANEDPLPFTDITLHFYSDMVSMEQLFTQNAVNAGGHDAGARESTHHMNLLPHEKLRVDAKMYCKYRGTYPVGVKSVSVTDFLGLFTITYPMKTHVRLTARPRLLPLEQLKQGLSREDPKNQLFSAANLQELPDYDLRPYQPGDPPKYIHWKNSARSGQLLVRKQMPEELVDIVVIMDLYPIAESGEKCLQIEDNIIEAALSFIHDYYLKQIPVRVIYMQRELKEIVVDSDTGFDNFYESCANLSFSSSYPPEQALAQYISRGLPGQSILLITRSVTDVLQRAADEYALAGNRVVLVATGEQPL